MSPDEEVRIPKIDETRPVVWTPEDASRFLTSAIQQAQKPLEEQLRKRPISSGMLTLLIALMIVGAIAIALILTNQLEKAEKRVDAAQAAREEVFSEKALLEAEAGTLKDRLAAVAGEQDALHGQIEALRENEARHRRTMNDLGRIRRQNELLRSQIAGMEMEKVALARQLEAVKALMETGDDAGDGVPFDDAGAAGPAAAPATLPVAEEEGAVAADAGVTPVEEEAAPVMPAAVEPVAEEATMAPAEPAVVVAEPAAVVGEPTVAEPEPAVVPEGPVVIPEEPVAVEPAGIAPEASAPEPVVVEPPVVAEEPEAVAEEIPVIAPARPEVTDEAAESVMTDADMVSVPEVAEAAAPVEETGTVTQASPVVEETPAEETPVAEEAVVVEDPVSEEPATVTTLTVPAGTDTPAAAEEESEDVAAPPPAATNVDAGTAPATEEPSVETEEDGGKLDAVL